MSRSWLQRKRKGELIELAQLTRIPDSDGYLKDDLVDLLDERLRPNEAMFGKLAQFRDYYVRAATPVKRELRSSPSESLGAVKTRRRTLNKSPESGEPMPEQKSPVTAAVAAPVAAVAQIPRVLARRVSSVVHEPRRVSDVLPQVDLPASPAQLASIADQSFAMAATRATELWSRTRIDEIKELVRENASSVAAIQTLILLIEASGLQYNTLGTTPLAPTPDTLVHVPDGWRLLTSEWWAPATLWSLTSWVLPLIASYFFNLTLRANTNRKSADRQYPADPLTFNIVKAILAWSAFDRAAGARFGPFSTETVDVVRGNVPGGYAGLQVGAVVGVLISLYDAALKK